MTPRIDEMIQLFRTVNTGYERERDKLHLGLLPLNRLLGYRCIVIGDGDGCDIGENGQKDDQVDANDFVQDEDRQGEVDFQVQTERYTVFDVGLHSVENFTRNLDRSDDGR